MALYTEIENAKKEINRLKSGLPFFKSEDRKAKQIKMINTFITLVNVCERMVAGSVDKNYIDAMLLYVFEMKYDSCQNDGTEGFISVETLNQIRKDIKFKVDQGRDNQIDALATQMAVDTLENSNLITEQEKLVPLTKDEKLLRLVGECTDHWKVQLKSFIDYCHNSGVVWS